METPSPTRTLDDYRGLFYHRVTAATQDEMDTVRRAYHSVAQIVLDHTPASRYQSLALTALEESLMRAIQSLAVHSPGSERILLTQTTTKEESHG